MDLLLLLIVFFAVCGGLLVLCTYKIYVWFKKPETQARINEYKKKQQQNPEAFVKATRMRNRTVGIFSAILILFFITSEAFDIPRTIAGFILFGLAVVMILSLNIITDKLWRCPACGKHLPVKIGRSGRRPKFVDTCPYCGHTLKNTSNIK